MYFYWLSINSFKKKNLFLSSRFFMLISSVILCREHYSRNCRQRPITAGPRSVQVQLKARSLTMQQLIIICTATLSY